jgi:hypothetical protein
MAFIVDYQKKFDDLKYYLDYSEQLKRLANGGNSILFSYPPHEEHLYLQKAKDIYQDQAKFIDLSQLFIQQIENDGWDEFEKFYQDFKSTPHKVFNSPEDKKKDLFKLIIDAIQAAHEEKKIPILIRTGVLLGTGIENVSIMENRSVMELKQPLVIFYPSKIEGENLFFLNIRLASTAVF